MSEPMVGRGKRLVEAADLIAPETVEEGIDVDLPPIDRLIIADELG
jgi:hypothetical protein